MSRILPDELPFHYHGRCVVLVASDGAYESACPVCLSTLAVPTAKIRLHRYETFSTLGPVTCPGCDTPFLILHSVATEGERESEEEVVDESVASWLM